MISVRSIAPRTFVIHCDDRGTYRYASRTAHEARTALPRALTAPATDWLDDDAMASALDRMKRRGSTKEEINASRSPVQQVASRSFDLNIERILEGWEIHHAVRELIANALDEQILSGTMDVEIFERHGKWFIRDFGRGLRHEHFTENENREKLANSDKVIGRFGVGLKDAIATLNRHGIKLTIRSRHCNVTVDQQSKYGFSDIMTLHAIIAPPDDPKLLGTEIVLEGVSQTDIGRAKSFFLKYSNESELERNRYGYILNKKDNAKARIYVNGILVAEESNFVFSYNITSLTQRMRNALNRERTNVGRTAYADRIKEMLLEARSEIVTSVLVEELGNIQFGRNSDEIKWMEVAKHVARILNANERVIFASPLQLISNADDLDHAKSEGIRIVAVPDTVRESFGGLRDLAGNAIRDVSVYQEERRTSFKFVFVDYENLSPSERSVFDVWETIAALGGGLPAAVKEIKITEAMRPDSVLHDHTVGLWEPISGNIIIRRDQLSSLGQFAATLLHEMVHAESGFSDVTRDFEIELTSMLGRIVAATLQVGPRSCVGSA